MENKELILLVDEEDREIGYEEKLKVHEKALLHRAFSIFIFNSKEEMLLQKRDKGKYHSPGLWTNTCCSHQRKGEALKEAIHRRLQEEMGFDSELKERFTFIYRAEFDNGLTEYELDHVFTGIYEGHITPNSSEVEDYRWISFEELKTELKEKPEIYTYWFKASIDKLFDLYNSGELLD